MGQKERKRDTKKREKAHRCLLRVRHLSRGLYPLRLGTTIGRSDGGDGGDGRH